MDLSRGSGVLRIVMNLSPKLEALSGVRVQETQASALSF